MNYKFILGLGRSGTKFFAGFLDDLSPHQVFQHEPKLEDKHLVFPGFNEQNHLFRSQYLRLRFNEIEEEVKSGFSEPVKIYGESNSYLRHESKWLKEHLDADVLFIARNARQYIVSAFPRKVYTAEDPQQWIVPGDDDPMASKWSTNDRFEMLCWYWQSTNRKLLEDSSGKVFRMEDLLSDYSYCHSCFNDEMDLEIPSAYWHSRVGLKANTTKGYTRKQAVKRIFRREQETQTKLEWNDSEEEKYRSICGPVLKDLGYELG